MKALSQNVLQIYKWIEEKKFLFYCLSLFLLHIPYYYLFLIKINVLNSYALARIITFFLFGIFTLSPTYRKILSQKQDLLSYSIAIFLFANAFSILHAFDMKIFLGNFEDVFFGVLFYFNTIIICSLYPAKKLKWIGLAIIFSSMVSILDELLMLMNPALYLQIAYQIQHANQLEFIETTLFRGRTVLNRYNEIFIPIFILLLSISKERIIKIALSILIGIILILALLSGWRIRLLIALLGIFSSVIIYRTILKKHIVTFFVIFVMLLSTILIGDYVMRSYMGYSTLGRLFLEDKSDISSLSSRISFFSKAIDLFKSSPITGVGLGHYPLIGGHHTRFSYSIFTEIELDNKLLNIGPHNMFFQLLAETGLIGFLAFTLFTFISLKEDWQYALYFKVPNYNLRIALILSFWFLFMFGIFHSEFGFQFYALLFGLRAAIHTLK